MPCQSDEEEAQSPEPPNPVTPMKPQRNDGAGYDNSDAEIPLTQSDEEEEERPKQKSKCVIAEYEPVKLWVTGERAAQPEEDIEHELLEEARESMNFSGLKKLPGQKGLDTDLHLLKKASAGHKTRTGTLYTISRCPLQHQCKCIKTIRVGRGRALLILERCGLHDVHSHDYDGFKYLKYDQITSLSEAAITEPNLSGSAIRNNMLLHDSPSKTIGAEHSRSVMR
jgi:hypothetical protein